MFEYKIERYTYMFSTEKIVPDMNAQAENGWRVINTYTYDDRDLFVVYEREKDDNEKDIEK